MANVCVFCGSRPGDRPEFVEAARRLGHYLAEHGHTLVFGGGSSGMMGAVADAALESGGQIIGVIPGHLARAELIHAGVGDMRITVNMHERKATMHDLSDVYVTLPGGLGTMEEFFEAITWAQLELHSRPIALLNLFGVYDHLTQLIDNLLRSGFLSEQCLQQLKVVEDLDPLLKWIGENTQPPLNRLTPLKCPSV